MKKFKLKAVIALLILSFAALLSCEDRVKTPGIPVDDYTLPVASGTVTDKISVYFTDPDNTLDPANIENSAPGKALVELVNKQTSGNMYLCFYEFDYQPVIDAVNTAISNGVTVYFVGDIDEGDDPGYTALISAITSHGGSEKEAIQTGETAKPGYSLIYPDSIMHNKFALITDSETGKQFVWTGSTNVTNSGMVYNNNNSVIIESGDLYDVYLQQFRFLYDGSKEAVSEKQNIAVGNVQLSVLFSYENSGRDYSELPVSTVASLISEAGSAVYFMAFSFTHTGVSSALEERMTAGLTVQGVLDESQSVNTNKTVTDSFDSTGLDYRIDGNREADPDYALGGAKLHHKCVIIDPEDLEKALVITGSTNLTNNGNDANAENMLLIYSRDYADLYVDEFKKRWDEAGAPSREYVQ